MLIWDIQAVSEVLETQPAFEDNSSYRFCFSLLGHSATLNVFPYSGDVRLAIARTRDCEAEILWQLNCSEITYNDDPIEEGGGSLVFKPSCQPSAATVPSHWVVMSRGSTGLQVLTVFRDASPV
jgi:hypothetical protein